LDPYPYAFNGEEIDAAPLLAALWQDYQKGTARERVARRFHDTLVALLTEAATRVAAATGLRRVALSGGTWQNRYLFLRTEEELRRAGFTVFSHRQAPANDGGLALGQTLVADRRWQEECA
jgi:hydrogenase maturation protein HypF